MLLKKIVNNLNRKDRFLSLAGLILFIFGIAASGLIFLREHGVVTPVRGGFYREGIIGQPISVNPVTAASEADSDLAAVLFSSLKNLASSIETKKDNRTYNVKIFENLKWSDGKPLTADDIVFTVKIIQNPKSASSLYKNWAGVSVERISELQVQFILPNSYAFFDGNLDKLRIIPKHIFENIPPENFALSSFNLKPVTSGPYAIKKIEKRKDGFITQYHLEINKKYHKDLPYIKDFFFNFFETEDDVLKAFRLRQIDGFGAASPVSPKIKSGNVTIAEIPMARYYAVFLNNNSPNPILQNKQTREILSAVINKSAIVKKIFEDFKPYAITNPVPESWLVTNKLDDENSEEAKPLVETLKQKESAVSLNLIVPKIPFMEKTAEEIKHQLESAGVDELTITALPSEEIASSVLRNRNYDMILFGHILDNPDDLFPFWHSTQTSYPGLNIVSYKNFRVDSLLEKIRTSLEPEERTEFLKDLSSIIQSDSPAIFLFQMPYAYVHRNRLQGLKIEKNFIGSANERFENISSWHVLTARVIKKTAVNTPTAKN